MRIAVFGDSILWGQGLMSDDKIAAKVVQALQQQGRQAELLPSFAHSGADVWHDGESEIEVLNPMPGPLPPLPEVPSEVERNGERECPAPEEREAVGEMPSDVPFSLRQVDKAAVEFAHRTPDLILVDAGINDVNVTNIVLPFKSRHALVNRTRSTVDVVSVLLTHARAEFPSVPIVVTGYYKIVSAQSDPARLLLYAARVLDHTPQHVRSRFNLTAIEPQFAATVTILASKPRASWEAGSVEDLLIGQMLKRLVELSALFADTMNNVLREVAGKFSGVSVAVPEIGPEHAVFTKKPWLWGLGPGLKPMDPLAKKRKEYCDRNGATPLQRFIWERASLGHPNKRGAQAYADAILECLKTA